VHLRQALAIYQRIGAPAARRVQKIFQSQRLTSTTPRAPASGTPSSEGHNSPLPPSPPPSR
jgi:hypothetical protein